jgi:hypothetical protein
LPVLSGRSSRDSDEARKPGEDTAEPELLAPLPPPEHAKRKTAKKTDTVIMFKNCRIGVAIVLPSQFIFKVRYG